MPSTLLPNLKEFNSDTIAVGKWNSKDDLLDTIIKGIKDDMADNIIPHSTPSIFERVYQFQYIMKNKVAWPQLYSEIVQEWRAVIALLALNDIRKLNIKLQKVGLNNTESHNEFLSICSESIAKPTIGSSDAVLPNGNFDTVYNIIIDYRDEQVDKTLDKVIALTTPFTLISTSKDFRALTEPYYNNFISFLPYSEVKRRIDNKEDWTSVLAKQFKKKSDAHIGGLSYEEAKSISEWLTRFERDYDKLCQETGARAVPVLAQEINDFRKSLMELYPERRDDLGKTDWYGRRFFYRNNAFAEAVTPAFQLMNFTINQAANVNDGEDKKNWNALVSVLALKDIRNLDVRIAEQGEIWLNRDGIANKDAYTIITPASDITANETVKALWNAEADLNGFELLCIINWIERLERKIANEQTDHAELLEKLERSRKHFYDLMQSKRDYSLNELFNPNGKLTSHWADNRFAENKFLFDFTVHKFNAPFFEDKTNGGYGSFHKKAARGWFNTLELIALKGLRDLSVNIQKTDRELGVNLNLNGLMSDLQIDRANGLFAISLDGVNIAQTSAATVIAPVDNEELFWKTYDDIAPWGRPERGEEGKRHIAAACQNKIAADNFLFDYKFYDFEVIIFIKWLQEFKSRIENFVAAKGVQSYDNERDPSFKSRIESFVAAKGSPTSGVNQDRTDCDIIAKIIEQKENELWRDIGQAREILTEYSKEKYLKRNVLFDETQLGHGRTLAFNFTYTFDLFTKNMLAVISNKDGIFENKIKNADGTFVNLVEDPTAPDSLRKWALIPLSESFVNETFKNDDLDKRKTGLDVFGIKNIKFKEQTVAVTDRSYFKENSENIIEASYTSAALKVPVIKVYRKCRKEITEMEEKEFPLLYVWPDVEIAGWKDYYVTYTTGNSAAVAAEKQISVYGNTAGRSEAHSITLSETDRLDFKVGMYENYPRVFAFSFNTDSGVRGGYFFSEPCNFKDRGKSYIERNADKKAIIGVDFGTSNTIAYMYTGAEAEQPEPINIASSMSQLITKRTQDGILHELVLSVPKVGSKRDVFNTALLKYSEIHVGEPFLQSVIYHMIGNEVFRAEKDKSSIVNNPLFRANLKAGDDSNSKEIKAFLYQLVLQCCVAALKEYAASKIEFRVSYPTGLAEEKLTAIKDQWIEIIGLFPQVTGFPQINDTGYFYTESYASGKYQMTSQLRQAVFDEGFVCIDIGGGTSDFSVWQSRKVGDLSDKGTKPLAQTSLAFAGRTILINEKEKEAFVKTLVLVNDNIDAKCVGDGKGSLTDQATTQSIKLLQDNYGSMKGDRFLFLCDLALGNIAKRLEERGGLYKIKDVLRDVKKEEEVKIFVAYAKFALCALSYMTGLIVKKLIEKGKFELRSAAREYPQINIYMAGNGSKSLEWITRLPNDEESAKIDRDEFLNTKEPEARALLPYFIRKGLGEQCKPNLLVDIHTSERPKHEVACGLVTADPQAATTKPDITDSIIPVNFERARRKYGQNKQRLIENIEGQLEQNGYGAEEIASLGFYKKDADATDYFNEAVKLVNPDFTDDAIAELLFDFMATFRKYCEPDYRLIIGSAIEGSHGISEDGAESPQDTALKMYISRQIFTLKSDDERFPVRDFTGFALLKLVEHIKRRG